MPARRASSPVRLGVRAGVCALALAAAACGGRTPAPAARPSILLVTLDTTRADAIGPEAPGVATPAFNRLASRGRRFRQAYATVPETLPSHAAMLTGLYPAGTSVHENGRFLPADRELVAERLRAAGYRTAAYVSSFALARQFGLARGFDVYDDTLPEGAVERSSRATTDAALASLGGPSGAPLFLWVHYYDPHYPYAPPEPYRSRYSAAPYKGEVAAMDEQLGRLVAAFDQRAPGPTAIIVVGDHGEGLGEHGERFHGDLLYQSTMHVPLVIVGPGVTAGTVDAPVSTRRVFNTLLDWAGVASERSLRGDDRDAVLGEAMKPYLEYGWQPQVMTVDGSRKAILTSRMELYDLAADPGETVDASGRIALSPGAATAIRDYPIPSLDPAPAPAALSAEDRQKLASLGYVGAGSAPVVRRDAPRPADMTSIFETIDEASGLFVAGDYARAVPLLRKILAADPGNLDATLRLATAESSLGRTREAEAAFDRAKTLAPRSLDVDLYLALDYARGPRWAEAAPLLERVLAAMPERLAALEALAAIREKQDRPADALALRQRIAALHTPTAGDLARIGSLAMATGDTAAAIDAFERARRLTSGSFGHDLDLGVLYLASRRFPEAREALDRFLAGHPDDAMGLFKRAQVSVLLGEPDQSARIALARRHANATTRALIASERLFSGKTNGQK